LENHPPPPDSDRIEAFIARWQSSGGAERANAQLFLSELCDLLDLPKPDPARPENALNRYTFERAVTRQNPDGTTTTAYLDLYRAGSFVLETKQGTAGTSLLSAPADPADPVVAASGKKSGHGKRGTPAWDTALERAYNQARRYIRELPPSEGRPPFLIVCDVGHVIELYSEFTCTGGVYVRFPDPQSHRIYLEDLRRPEIRERLRGDWHRGCDGLARDPRPHCGVAGGRQLGGYQGRLD
jgi:hypothetical protein